MAELGLTFNARLYEIEQAFERGNLEPLVAYLRSGTIDQDVQKWMTDRIDPAITGGHKLVIKGPKHRPSGGKSFDLMEAIGQAMHELVADPTGQRTEKARVAHIAKVFKVSTSTVRNDYRRWKKARDFYPIDE